MTWATRFAMALEAFMRETATIKLADGGTLSISNAGAPVHFNIGSAFVALEEYELGKFDGENATLQIGSTLVTYAPPAASKNTDEGTAVAAALVAGIEAGIQAEAAHDAGAAVNDDEAKAAPPTYAVAKAVASTEDVAPAEAPTEQAEQPAAEPEGDQAADPVPETATEAQDEAAVPPASESAAV